MFVFVWLRNPISIAKTGNFLKAPGHRGYHGRMDFRSLHPWNLPPKEAVALQRELRGRIRIQTIDPADIKVIAGMDVSSSRFSPVLSAGIVLWDTDSQHVLEAVSVQMQAEFPYIPGLLSFREIPALLEAWKRLSIRPDAVLVDGQGIAHPRRLGIATHVGLLVDVPTVGVGKSKLTGTHGETGPMTGDSVPLMDGTEEIGTVLRSKPRSNPLFVSPGNGIDLPSAVALVRKCLRGYRLPEPTRLAHMHVNLVRTTGRGLDVTRALF